MKRYGEAHSIPYAWDWFLISDAVTPVGSKVRDKRRTEKVESWLVEPTGRSWERNVMSIRHKC
jgi:hypothetical protein